VPLSSDEFLTGLQQRDFPERDVMIFLPSQVGEYDKKRAQVEHSPQMELFVSDERSAIDWLAEFLKKRPSTYQEVHPEFITELVAGWRKHEEKPELTALLEENFLRYDGTGPVPTQINSYLSKNFHDCRGLDKDDPSLMAKAKSAGTCWTRTRRRIWRGGGKSRCCRSSKPTGPTPAGGSRNSVSRSYAPASRRLGPRRTSRPSSRSPARSPRWRSRKTRNCCSGMTRH